MFCFGFGATKVSGCQEKILRDACDVSMHIHNNPRWRMSHWFQSQ